MRIAAPRCCRRVATVELLNAYGFECARSILVKSILEGKTAATAKIGYPVILKGMVPNVAHRSDAGLVSGKISDATELDKEFAAASCQSKCSHRRIDADQRREVCRA